MDQEAVVLEVDPRSVLQAIKQANQAVEGWEKGTVSAGDSMQKSLERMADMLLKVNDKSRSSMERLTQSIEKQAAAYGRTGVDRLVSERDRLIKKLGDEQGMIERVTAAYSKMIEVESKKGGGQESSLKGFAESVKGFVENPLQSAKGAIGGVVEAIGPFGVALVAGAATLGSIGAAGFEAAKGLAEYGLQIKNVELRTGLTSKEVGQFGFAARMAGQDASIFERMMKGLAEASDEQASKGDKARSTLRNLGVELRGVTGEMKPTSQLLLEISESLSKLPEGVERDAAAMALFKKIGIEAIPVITGLTENVKRAKELGLGATEEDLARWEKYHQNVTEAEVLWERFTRKIKEPLAALVTVMFQDRGGRQLTPEELEKHGISLGKWKPATQQERTADLRRFGFGQVADQSSRVMADDALDYIRKIDQRRTADTFITGMDARRNRDLQYQLQQAEKDLSGMAVPKVGTTSIEDAHKYDDAAKKVESLKNQIKARETAERDLQKFKTEAAAYEKRGDEAELNAIEKIYYERDLLLKQAEKTKGAELEIAAIRQSADKQAAGVLKKSWEAFEEYNRKSRQEETRERNSSESWRIFGGGPSNAQLKDWEKGFAADDRIAGIELQSKRDTLNRNAGRAMRTVELSGLTGSDAIRAAYQVRINLAGQLAVVEAQRISKEDDADKRRVETAQAQKDLQKSMAEAQEEASMKQLELEKQRMDTIKREAEGLWNTLLTKPSEFGKQLAGTVRSALLKPVTEGLATMSANFLKPIIYGADGESGIAGFFKGMFGGKQADPLKMSTDMNTAVTAQNSVALATLTAILAGGMGMSVPAMAAPAGFGGMSLPSISVPAAGGGSVPMMGGGGGGSIPSILGGGGGGQASGGSGFGGLTGLLRNFKGMNWGGLTRSPSRWSMDEDGNLTQLKDSRITGVNGVAGAAMFAGGSMLAQQGLLGSWRGTWGGVGAGALGGAAVGFQMGGPLGGIIGGAVGGLIGLGEKIAGVETAENEAKRLVKQIYSLTINDATAKQIAAIAKQSYGGQVSVAVRTAEVRQMLQLYAESTGQKSNLFLNDPHGVNLVQSGGLRQSAVYNNGTPYTYQSNLSVMGPAGSTIPSGNPFAGGVTVVVSPEQTANLWATGVAAGIAGSPRQVAASAVNGGNASSSRVAGAIMTLAPNQIAF